MLRKLTQQVFYIAILAYAGGLKFRCIYLCFSQEQEGEPAF